MTCPAGETCIHPDDYFSSESCCAPLPRASPSRSRVRAIWSPVSLPPRRNYCLQNLAASQASNARGRFLVMYMHAGASSMSAAASLASTVATTFVEQLAAETAVVSASVPTGMSEAVRWPGINRSSPAAEWVDGVQAPTSMMPSAASAAPSATWHAAVWHQAQRRVRRGRAASTTSTTHSRPAVRSGATPLLSYEHTFLPVAQTPRMPPLRHHTLSRRPGPLLHGAVSAGYGAMLTTPHLR